MPAKPKVGCYVRVSTKDKQTTASQRQTIREWSKAHHVSQSHLRWYEDKSSGKTTDNRPQLAKMLHAIDLGRIDTVVVYDLSRLARNTQDGLRLLATLCEKGIRVVSVTENIDFGNSAGQLIATILLAVAQFDRETRNERIRAGIAARREAGKTIGRTPDVAKHERVRSMYEDGVRVPIIAETMNTTRQNIYRILKATQECA